MQLHVPCASRKVAPPQADMASILDSCEASSSHCCISFSFRPSTMSTCTACCSAWQAASCSHARRKQAFRPAAVADGSPHRVEDWRGFKRRLQQREGAVPAIASYSFSRLPASCRRGLTAPQSPPAVSSTVLQQPETENRRLLRLQVRRRRSPPTHPPLACADACCSLAAGHWASFKPSAAQAPHQCTLDALSPAPLQSPALAAEQGWVEGTAAPTAGGLLLATPGASQVLGPEFSQVGGATMPHGDRWGSDGPPPAFAPVPLARHNPSTLHPPTPTASNRRWCSWCTTASRGARGWC